jgi:hypothetical protein
MFAPGCEISLRNRAEPTHNEEELKNISLRFERLSDWLPKMNRGVATDGVEPDLQQACKNPVAVS